MIFASVFIIQENDASFAVDQSEKAVFYSSA